MSHYDYKVVPAPKRAKKVKGVRTAEDPVSYTHLTLPTICSV